MIWPTLVVDNFFKDPLKVKKFSLNLEYGFDEEFKWPGKRTISLDLIDKDFYCLVNRKILSLLYPMNVESFNWSSSQFFQKISSNYNKEGWVHQDRLAEFTAIIYLSEHENCGTTIYTPKNFYNSMLHTDKKKESYKNTNILEDTHKYLIENNERFDKSIIINSKFNRLLIFDGSQYHAAEKFVESNISEDRLTLITFFYNINCDQIKYPIPQMNRI